MCASDFCASSVTGMFFHQDSRATITVATLDTPSYTRSSVNGNASNTIVTNVRLINKTTRTTSRVIACFIFDYLLMFNTSTFDKWYTDDCKQKHTCKCDGSYTWKIHCIAISHQTV